MQRSRSFVRFLWPGFAALLVINCTVKVENDKGSGGSSNGGSGTSSGGSSSGGATVAQGGALSSGGNVTAAGGATSGGYAGASAGQAGAGGVGGVGGVGDSGAGGLGGAGGSGGASADACEDCLLANCTAELDACLDDIRCFNDDASAPGQYQDMVQCIDQVRVMHSVKRVDVVDCGLAIANSASLAWPPDEMATTTTDLINCMATGESNKPNNNGWSDGDPDVATDPISQKWADGSCAKSSCTSQL
jgi:hypothetical protein